MTTFSKFKRTVGEMQEEILKLKSNVRLTKAKYVQSLKNSGKKLDQYQKYDSAVTRGKDGFLFSGVTLGATSTHSQADRYIDNLAQGYFLAQRMLNDKIQA